MNILDDLKGLTDLNSIEEYIKNLFNDSIEDKYIPAIINEGSYTVEKGEDFYLKLVLAHQKIVLKKPWLKQNLSFGLVDPDYGYATKKPLYNYLVENVITLRNVKGNRLYQLNPIIVNESIEEYEYNNNVCVNAYYNSEYAKVKGIPVLKSTDSKNILVIKDVLLPVINDLGSNLYPKYKLVAEYEYRTHETKVQLLKTGIYKTSYGVHDVYIGENGLHIIGSVVVELPKEELSFNKRNIKVIDLNTGKIKSHNPKNFDDDTDAGFVVFKRNVLALLKKEYYFYDLIMFEKANVDNQYKVDLLKDKVVFWEGEYNRLPLSLKKRIDDYNYVPSEIKNIISPGMMAWQLESDWHYYKKLLPEQLLAWKIREKYFNAAIELGISFVTPEDISEFRTFIQYIEKITNIRLSLFDNNYSDVQILLEISTGREMKSHDFEMELLYRKYCYQIYRMIENE